MSLIKQINEEAEFALVQQALLENIQQLEEFVETSTMNIAALEKAYDAAKRGLGIANKLKSAEDKRKHLSRVMTNMNKIRAAAKKRAKEGDLPEAKSNGFMDKLNRLIDAVKKAIASIRK